MTQRNIGRLILVAIALVVGIAVFAPSNEDRPRGAEKIIGAIQKEIRKQDPWVESVVQSDYTTGWLSVLHRKSVHLRFRRPEVEAKLEKMGFTGSHASYSQQTNDFFVPLNAPEPEDSIDAVDHELFHALYDNVGVKGLIHSSGFEGPSDSQIADYVHRKMQTPAFVSLQEKMEQRKESQRLVQRIESGINQYTAACKSSLELLISLRREYLTTNTISEVGSYVSTATLIGYDKSRHALTATLKNHIAFIQSEYKSVRATKAETQVALREFALRLENKAKSLGAILNETQQLHAVVRSVIKAAQQKKYEADLQEVEARLKAEKDPATRKSLADWRDSLIEGHNLVALMDSLDPTISATSFNGMLADAKEFGISIVRDGNVFKIERITEDPNEVMARVVDSAYSLYFGPVRQNQYPLDESDMKFLESFKYQGRPLFRKGVEKYRLGLRMIAEGAKPDAVKAQLEYATSWTYKGVHYDWPESQYVITGTPPYDQRK